MGILNEDEKRRSQETLNKSRKKKKKKNGRVPSVQSDIAHLPLKQRIRRVSQRVRRMKKETPKVKKPKGEVPDYSSYDYQYNGHSPNSKTPYNWEREEYNDTLDILRTHAVGMYKTPSPQRRSIV